MLDYGLITLEIICLIKKTCLKQTLHDVLSIRYRCVCVQTLGITQSDMHTNIKLIHIVQYQQ